jgi:serine/threonine protein kinase
MIYKKLYILLSIARGMKKLHASGLLQKDLKALNILVGKGSEMVSHEDKSYMAEMISPYLFLSIKIGGLREVCECGGRRTNSRGHQKCCKP